MVYETSFTNSDPEARIIDPHGGPQLSSAAEEEGPSIIFHHEHTAAGKDCNLVTPLRLHEYLGKALPGEVAVVPLSESNGTNSN